MKNLKIFALLCAVLSANAASAQWFTTGNTLTSTGIFGGNTGNFDILFRRNGVQSGLLNSANSNTSFGVAALNAASSGTLNTAFGTSALAVNTTGFNNTATGANALANNTTGNNNIAVGISSLYTNTTGYQNVSVGVGALNVNLGGQSNVAIGSYSMVANTSGPNNAAVGYQSLSANTSGQQSAALGYQSLIGSTTGSNNVGIGYRTLATNTTGSNNTALGYSANVGSAALTNATAIGANAVANLSNSIVLGSGANVGIGTSSPNASALLDLTSTTQGLLFPRVTTTQKNAIATPAAGLEVYDNTVGQPSYYNGSTWVNLGASSGWSLIGNSSTVPGTNFMGTTDDKDVIFKRNNVQGGWLNSFNPTTNVGANTSWGVGANPVGSGNKNTAVGYNAFPVNTTGSDNVSIGFESLFSNTTGIGNVAVGDASLVSNTTGNNNVATGTNVLVLNTTGAQNTAYGSSCLSTNTTGLLNTAIGYEADVNNNNLQNATALGAYAKVGKSNSIVLGGTGTYAINVGIGTPTPDASALLDLTSTTQGLLFPRVTTTQKNAIAAPAAGLEVYDNTLNQPSYYNGTAWVNLGSASGWSLTGNAGTTPGVGAGQNFMGTTDNKDVVFARDGVQAGLLNTNNTSWGLNALNPASTGNVNVAVGFQALYSNTNGGGNSAVGFQALYANQGGSDNTAFGNGALMSNVSGNENEAIGDNAMQYNTTGSANVADGSQALQHNTTGTENVAVGVNAAGFNTTGSNNVGIGNNTLTNNTAGNFITALGADAGVTVDNLTNATVIGEQALVSQSNTMIFGNGSVVGWGFGVTSIPTSDAIIVGNNSTNGNGAYLTTGGAWTNGSDKNIKEDFSTLDSKDVLSKIKSLPITRWKYKGTSEYHIGPMAQDFYKAFNVGNDDKHISTIDPASIALIAVQELTAQNDVLKEGIAQQQETNNNLQQQLNDLKTTIAKMQTAMSQCCNSYSSNMATATLKPQAINGNDAAALQQNAPNPYNSSTVIAYHLPQSTTNAEIIVTDLSGNVLKSISLNGNGDGQVTFSAGSFASGTYFYTLLINGQKIDTKEMIIAK